MPARLRENGAWPTVLVMAVAMHFSYFFSEKIALISARAQRVSENEYQEIYVRLAPIVGTLSQRMGVPMPKLRATPDLSPNAFATDRNPHTLLWPQHLESCN